MVALRLYLEDTQLGAKFERGVKRQADRVRTAVRGTAQEAADLIKVRGALDIASAGNFGTRWTRGINVQIGEGGGNIRLEVSHSVPYFMVFQRGALIRGHPLLWIPFSGSGLQNVWARDYPGSLFRVNRKSGVPILMDRDSRTPKYFGIASVSIPKKFHLIEIIQDVAKELRNIYNVRFKNTE